jgi:hypothetical protein
MAVTGTGKRTGKLWGQGLPGLFPPDRYGRNDLSLFIGEKSGGSSLTVGRITNYHDPITKREPRIDGISWDLNFMGPWRILILLFNYILREESLMS